MQFQWQMKTDGEVVYTMTHFYDGPAEGIADCAGRPHAYRRMTHVGTEHEDGDLFELWPIDAETFRLALEDWAIWERWEVAFHAGKTGIETHPALPEDRARNEELDAVLKARLAPPAEGTVLARGQFRQRARPGAAREGMGLKVWWTPVGSPGRVAPSPWPSPEGRGNDAHCG
jgi:hypothetical protein